MTARIRIGEPHRLQAFGLPSGRGKAHYMGYIRPLALCAGSIQSISSDVLRSARGDVLCELQEKTHHGKDLGFLLEELVVGFVGDHRGLAVQIGFRQSARQFPQ